MKMKLKKMMGSLLAVLISASLMWQGVSLPVFADGQEETAASGSFGASEKEDINLGENVHLGYAPGLEVGDTAATVKVNDEAYDPMLNYRNIPGDHYVQSLTEGESLVAREMGTPPSRWDNTNFASYMPELRDQGKFGSCWAQSQMAAIEINLAKKGLLKGVNFSEVQHTYFVYNWVTDPLGGTAGDSNKGLIQAGDNYLATGGNVDLGKNVLMSWTGAAVEEGPLVYPSSPSQLPSSLDSSYAYDHDKAHLREYHTVYIDPSKGANSADMIAAKNELMDKGCLIMNYHALNGRKAETRTDIYNSATNAYYDPEDYGGVTNHAVVIVGWDDNFPATDFAQTPGGNGAWLVRNSWSTGNFEDHQNYSGYFWISYYNACTNHAALSYDCELTGNYDYLYQYDGAMTSGLTWSDGVETAKIANVFQAKANPGGEILKAVCFNSAMVNTKYDVSVYVSDAAMKNSPQEGTLKASMSGTTSFEGYYTLDLNQPVALKPGQYYSVVVKLSTPGRTTCIPVEMSTTVADYFSCYANIVRGQSFIERGGNWYDGVDYKALNPSLSALGNFRIKALTDNSPISPETTDLTLQTKKTKKVAISLSSGDALKEVTSSNKNAATAKISGNSVSITAGKKKGSTNITVTTTNGNSAIIKVTVQTGKVTTKKLSLSAKKATLTAIGQKYSLTAIASPDRISTGETFKASTSNKKVATVSVDKKTGVATVTAKKNGTANITVSCGSKKATCKITVKGPVALKDLKYTKNVTIKAGKTKTVKITPNPKDASLIEYLEWYTYNRYVAMFNTAKLDSKNVWNVSIAGVGRGKTTFKVAVFDVYGKYKVATFNVTVK